MLKMGISYPTEANVFHLGKVWLASRFRHIDKRSDRASGRSQPPHVLSYRLSQQLLPRDRNWLAGTWQLSPCSKKEQDHRMQSMFTLLMRNSFPISHPMGVGNEPNEVLQGLPSSFLFSGRGCMMEMGLVGEMTIVVRGITAWNMWGWRFSFDLHHLTYINRMNSDQSYLLINGNLCS